MKLTREKLREILKKVLEELYREENVLINIAPTLGDTSWNDTNKHAGERAIAFKFGHYLEEELKGLLEGTVYKIDMEYNREESEVKKLDDKKVTPDLIIHERQKKNNLVIIEFKGWWQGDEAKEDDKKRVKNFVEDSKYEYKFGVAIVFERKKEDSINNLYIYSKNEIEK